MSVLRQGVAYERIDALRIGQRVDLQNDMFADSEAYEALQDGANAEDASEHPEFEFEYEVVATITHEDHGCICIEFESGFTCGFPVDHEVEIDPEQDLLALANGELS